MRIGPPQKVTDTQIRETLKWPLTVPQIAAKLGISVSQYNRRRRAIEGSAESV